MGSCIVHKAQKETVILGLRMLGCPEVVSRPLVTKLMQNVAAEGPENVVKRLKVIKRAAVATLAGEVPQFTWIKSDGKAPKGAWKPVWKWLVSTSHEKREHAFSILMVYTVFFHPQNDVPTRTQLEKFIGSVCQPPEIVAGLEPVFRLVPALREFQIAGEVLKRFVKASGYDVSTRVPVPTFLEQVTASLGLEKDCFERTSLHFIEKAKKFLSLQENDVWLRFPQYREVMLPFLEEEASDRMVKYATLLNAQNLAYQVAALEGNDEEIAKLRTCFATTFETLDSTGDKGIDQCLGEAEEKVGSFRPPGSWVPKGISGLPEPTPGCITQRRVCGNVAYIQEAGYKMRAFASPSLPLQYALASMKEVLFGVLRSLPWDCCFDQSKGVERVRTWLNEGKTCYSVDLSDATNNASWVMQVHLLKQLGVNESDINLLHSVNTGLYRNPWYKDGWGEAFLQWNVGQPLGTGPSFAVFSLFHAYLVIASMVKAKVSLKYVTDTFVILGDDIVINDQRVHQAYRNTLKLISAPVSESKCLESSTAAEFAGVLITSKGSYRGWKFKDVDDDNFLSVIQHLGPRVLSRAYLTKRQYIVAKYLRDLPYPYGLGYNSKGLPRRVYEDLKKFLDEWHLQHEAIASSRPIPSKSSSLNRLLYGYGIRWYRAPAAPWITAYLPFMENDPEARKTLTLHAPLASPQGIMRVILGDETLPIVTKGRPSVDLLAQWRSTYVFGAAPHLKQIEKGRSWIEIIRNLYPSFLDSETSSVEESNKSVVCSVTK
jgi:hypothetical protein